MRFDEIPPSYLLVGEAPARDESKLHLEVTLALKSLGRPPHKGIVELCRDLSWLARHDPALFDFVTRTLHVNLLQSWPGRDGRGSAFPRGDAVLQASILTTTLFKDCPCSFAGLVFPQPRSVVLVGTRVAEAFGFKAGDYGFFEAAAQVGGVQFYVVPHPSGVNLFWNRKENASRAADFLRELGRRD